MKVEFKKLVDGAVIPTRAHMTDAGFDLTCTSIFEGGFDAETITYGTGVAVNIPQGYVGLLCSRSSIYKKDLIQNNSVGIIDAGYTGELIFKFRKMQPFTRRYEIGDKIGQLVIIPLPDIELEEVKDFSVPTDRGDNGFGSTGK